MPTVTNLHWIESFTLEATNRWGIITHSTLWMSNAVIPNLGKESHHQDQPTCFLIDNVNQTKQTKLTRESETNHLAIASVGCNTASLRLKPRTRSPKQTAATDLRNIPPAYSQTLESRLNQPSPKRWPVIVPRWLPLLSTPSDVFAVT